MSGGAGENRLTGSDDPFCAEADPYPPAGRIALREEAMPAACACGDAALSLTRRQALLGVGALVALPVAAAANPVPCVQVKQKITPCRHKFCRHYGGDQDYHGR